jgi:hypothetical protein
VLVEESKNTKKMQSPNMQGENRQYPPAVVLQDEKREILKELFRDRSERISHELQSHAGKPWSAVCAMGEVIGTGTVKQVRCRTPKETSRGLLVSCQARVKRMTIAS